MAKGKLTSQVRGEVGIDHKVLVIRRIHVTYHLEIPAEHRETAERVHAFHADFCPVARTISKCVEITTDLEIEEA